MTNPHWQYFRAVEACLEATTRYVEMTVENYGTHSVEFARLLLSASSEVDVMAKELCKHIDPSRAVSNIDDYRRCILSKYTDFAHFEIIVPRYDLRLVPWQSWSHDQNPTWWRSYNKVKHERTLHFDKANLENALNAVAGLFCLELAYSSVPAELSPWPTLVSVEEAVLVQMVLAHR